MILRIARTARRLGVVRFHAGERSSFAKKKSETKVWDTKEAGFAGISAYNPKAAPKWGTLSVATLAPFFGLDLIFAGGSVLQKFIYNLIFRNGRPILARLSSNSKVSGFNLPFCSRLASARWIRGRCFRAFGSNPIQGLAALILVGDVPKSHGGSIFSRSSLTVRMSPHRHPPGVPASRRQAASPLFHRLDFSLAVPAYLREAPTITQRNAKSRRQNDACSGPLPSPNTPATKFLVLNSGTKSQESAQLVLILQDSSVWPSTFQMGQKRRSDDSLVNQPPQSSRSLQHPPVPLTLLWHRYLHQA